MVMPVVLPQLGQRLVIGGLSIGRLSIGRWRSARRRLGCASVEPNDSYQGKYGYSGQSHGHLD
jgi:hypothetical protein